MTRRHLQLRPQLLANFGAVHPVEAPGVGVESAIVVHNVDDGQAQTLAYLEIVGVVARRDLQRAGPKFRVHVGVRDDWDRPSRAEA